MGKRTGRKISVLLILRISDGSNKISNEKSASGKFSQLAVTDLPTVSQRILHWRRVSQTEVCRHFVHQLVKDLYMNR